MFFTEQEFTKQDIIEKIKNKECDFMYPADISDILQEVYEPKLEDYLMERFDEAEWDKSVWNNFRPLEKFLENYYGLAIAENNELKLLPFVLNIKNLTYQEACSPLNLEIFNKCELVTFDDFETLVQPYLDDIEISWSVGHLVELWDEDDRYHGTEWQRSSGTEHMLRDFTANEVLEQIYLPETHGLPEGSELRLVGKPQCLTL